MGGGGKGGSGGPQQTQVTQSNLPEYARPYYERLMQNAETATTENYIPYPGQRLADFTPDTYSSFNLARNIAQGGDPWELGVAGGALQQGTNYQSGFNPMSFQGGTFGNTEAQQYMSPYIQNVLDTQKARLNQQFGESQLGRDAQAVQAGAFGGSRAAIQNEVARREKDMQMQEIDAAGLQGAFDRAGQLFGADRAARLQAEGMTDDSARMGEQFRQGAAGLGLGAAESLAGLGQLRQDLGFGRADALNRMGFQQQELEQRQADLGYQDFVNQRDYPYTQLQRMSALLQGVPIGQSSEIYTAPPNPLSQAVGLGLGGLGLYRALQG